MAIIINIILSLLINKLSALPINQVDGGTVQASQPTSHNCNITFHCSNNATLNFTAATPDQLHQNGTLMPGDVSTQGKIFTVSNGSVAGDGVSENCRNICSSELTGQQNKTFMTTRDTPDPDS